MQGFRSGFIRTPHRHTSYGPPTYDNGQPRVPPQGFGPPPMRYQQWVPRHPPPPGPPPFHNNRPPPGHRPSMNFRPPPGHFGPVRGFAPDFRAPRFQGPRPDGTTGASPISQHHHHHHANGHGHGYASSMKRNHNGGHTDGQSQSNKKRKTKEKAEAKSCPFYCEACDRGYQTKEKYDEHIATHIKCDLDGCPYVAAAKLVQIHRDQQHRNGLAKKIWQLQSDEDISKWIEERKRKFPTKDNISKKRVTETEKEERGEVLETKQFGRFRKGKKQNRRQNRKSNNKQDEDTDQKTETESDLKTISTDSSINTQMSDPVNELVNTEEETPKEPLAFGIKQALSEADSDDNADITAEDPVATDLGGALADLMMSYGVDSDIEDGEIITDLGKTAPLPDESTDVTETVQTKKREKRKNKNKRNNEKPVATKRHQSLLEKLLAKEIRHERNVLLQCVRYITQHDFFQETDNPVEGDKTS